VEEGVSEIEVATAVQTLLDQQIACLPWPGLWLEAGDRRSRYVVRFDLMARDWGADVAADSRARMDEFVALGFLSPREDETGAVDYALTREGRDHLRGSPYGGARPAFCGSLGRRLVAISAMEFGSFACGNLLVRFSHVADDWPAWARTESARAEVEAASTALGVLAEGAVSLRRQWFRRDAVPRGQANGALRSACYDQETGATSGDFSLLSSVPSR
jgi:hypothetical protein